MLQHMHRSGWAWLQDDPQAVVDGLVVLSHCSPGPQPFNTPYQAVALLQAHLGLFTDEQLLDVLQVRWRLGFSWPWW